MTTPYHCWFCGSRMFVLLVDEPSNGTAQCVTCGRRIRIEFLKEKKDDP